MNTDTAVPVPKLFMLHSNLSDKVNRNIAQSEIEGGMRCLRSQRKYIYIG